MIEIGVALGNSRPFGFLISEGAVCIILLISDWRSLYAV